MLGPGELLQSWTDESLDHAIDLFVDGDEGMSRIDGRMRIEHDGLGAIARLNPLPTLRIGDDPLHQLILITDDHRFATNAACEILFEQLARGRRLEAHVAEDGLRLVAELRETVSARHIAAQEA